MTLSDLASIGSLVSSAAVLVSLVYLSLQLRQADRNQQASIRLGRSTRFVEIGIACTEPSLAVAIAKGMAGDSDMTATQVIQFNHFVTVHLHDAEDAFYQHRDGLLNESAYATFTNSWRWVLSMPGWRAVWRRRRVIFVGEFLHFMDRIAAETAVVPVTDSLAQWNADVAAEKASAAQ